MESEETLFDKNEQGLSEKKRKMDEEESDNDIINRVKRIKTIAKSFTPDQVQKMKAIMEKENDWLDDGLIDYFIQCFLEVDARTGAKILYLSSLVVASFDGRYKAAKRSDAKELFTTKGEWQNYDYVMITIHDKIHWGILLYDVKNNHFYGYDILRNSIKHNCDELCKRLEQLGIIPKESKLDMTSVSEYKADGWSCGYYALLYARLIITWGSVIQKPNWEALRYNGIAPITYSFEFWEKMKLSCYFDYGFPFTKKSDSVNA